jgi:thiamine biosynthesis lipoprotein
LTVFEATSVVSAINRSWGDSGGAWCRVDMETFGLLKLCRKVWERTGGVFDPTVGALMRALGFRESGLDAAEVERARACTGMELVELDAGACRVRLLDPGVRLDLGAVGKGWAVDRAVAVLREAGVENALIHGGTSSVMGIGVGPQGRPWRVAAGPGPESPRVELRDAAMGVSAQRGRVVVGQGRVVGHVVDPAGDAARSAVVAGVETAVVVHASAAMADALSTALLLRPGMQGAWTDASTLVEIGVDGRRWWRGQCSDGCVSGAELSHV